MYVNNLLLIILRPPNRYSDTSSPAVHQSSNHILCAHPKTCEWWERCEALRQPGRGRLRSFIAQEISGTALESSYRYPSTVFSVARESGPSPRCENSNKLCWVPRSIGRRGRRGRKENRKKRFLFFSSSISSISSIISKGDVENLRCWGLIHTPTNTAIDAA